MIKHIYPQDNPTSGVSLYGAQIEPYIQSIEGVEKSIVHYELGYNEHDLLWGLYRAFRKHSPEKLVVTVHDSPVVVGKPFKTYLSSDMFMIKLVRKLLDKTAGYFVIRYVLRRASAVIVLNKAGVTPLVRRFNLDNEKLHFVPLFNLLDPTQILTPLPKQPQHRVVFFGNLSPRKGLNYLIAALPSLKLESPLTIKVVGSAGNDEPYTRSLREKIRQLPPTISVELLGFVEDNELSQLLDWTQVVVLPYVEENKIVHASGPLTSALSAGKAVVASDIPIFNTTIKDGENGILVAPHDSSAISDGLQEVLKNKVLQTKISKGAKQSALSFTKTAVKEGLRKVYVSL